MRKLLDVNQVRLDEGRGDSNDFETGLGNPGPEFKIAVVYEDAAALGWATQMCHPVAQKVGEEHVQNSWHSINSLRDPGVLREAVDAAVAADVIVVAIHAADGLPRDLCTWVDIWLLQRLARVGTLAALIGVGEPPAAHGVLAEEYLQKVAHRGQLDFVRSEHPPKLTFPGGKQAEFRF